jgi:hypothetical protein
LPSNLRVGQPLLGELINPRQQLLVVTGILCWLLRTSVQEIGLFCTIEGACLRQPC